MRSIIFAVLISGLAAVTASGEDSKILIKDIESLWTRDWYCSGYNNKSRRSQQMILSLRQDGEKQCKSSQPYSALKGTYAIGVNESRDGLAMRLAFTRRYLGTATGKEVRWEQDMDFNDDRVGGSFDIPLEDNKLPRASVTIANSSLYYVNSKGDYKTVYSGGLISVLKGETFTPYKVDDWHEGQIFKFNCTGPHIDAVRTTPPPGFHKRLN
jgi:hypothetical protein